MRSLLTGCCLPVVLLMLQAFLCVLSDPFMASIVATSPHHEMIVTLRCDGAPDGTHPCLYNRVGNLTSNVTVLGQTAKLEQYSVVLNVSTEGYYFCEAGNQRSNEILLIGKFKCRLIFVRKMQKTDLACRNFQP